jgi:hypothetical protein
MSYIFPGTCLAPLTNWIVYNKESCFFSSSKWKLYYIFYIKENSQQSYTIYYFTEDSVLF